jgi:response regulator of citrate/malate metabolism
LEEEAKCNQQEIKRLERRLDKYKAEKANLEKDKQIMQAHIKELEDSNFNQDNKLIQSYREKFQDEEIKRLRI